MVQGDASSLSHTLAAAAGIHKSEIPIARPILPSLYEEPRSKLEIFPIVRDKTESEAGVDPAESTAAEQFTQPKNTEMARQDPRDRTPQKKMIGSVDPKSRPDKIGRDQEIHQPHAKPDATRKQLPTSLSRSKTPRTDHMALDVNQAKHHSDSHRSKTEVNDGTQPTDGLIRSIHSHASGVNPHRPDEPDWNPKSSKPTPRRPDPRDPLVSLAGHPDETPTGALQDTMSSVAERILFSGTQRAQAEDVRAVSPRNKEPLASGPSPPRSSSLETHVPPRLPLASKATLPPLQTTQTQARSIEVKVKIGRVELGQAPKSVDPTPKPPAPMRAPSATQLMAAWRAKREGR